MRQLAIVLTSIATLLAVSACASSPGDEGASSSESSASTSERAPKATSAAQSPGFLPDYSKLEKDPNNPKSLRWVNPDIARADYAGIIVAPVVFHLDPKFAKEGVRPSAEAMNQIFDYFHEALVREFGRHFMITDKPGDGVMRYQAAITGLDTKTDMGDSPVDFLPVILVARTVTGANKVEAVIFMESFYKDSLTGQLLSEVVQSAEGSGLGGAKEVTLDSVRPVLDAWAKKAADGTKRELDQMKMKSS